MSTPLSSFCLLQLGRNSKCNFDTLIGSELCKSAAVKFMWPILSSRGMFENLLWAGKEPKQVGDFFLFISVFKGNRDQHLNMKFKNIMCEKKVIFSGCIIFREVHADRI